MLSRVRAFARSPRLAVDVESPARFRYRQTQAVRDAVENASAIAIDTAYIARFAKVTFEPGLDAMNSVPVTGVRPHERRLITVELSAEQYGRHRGRVLVSAGQDTVVRVVVTYLVVWACFRVVGKRELTQMTPFELVTLLCIPQLFSRALTREDYSMTNAFIGATTLFCLVFLTSALGHRFPRFRQVIEAKHTVLADRGQLVEPALNPR